MANLTALTLSVSTTPQSTAIGTVLATIAGYSQPAAIAMSGTPEPFPLNGSAGEFLPMITGGAGTKVLSVTDGALPPGRHISGLTVIGTYTTEGSYDYELTVYDANGMTAIIECTETVTTIDIADLFHDPMGGSGAVDARSGWSMEYPEGDAYLAPFTVAGGVMTAHNSHGFALADAQPSTNYYRVSCTLKSVGAYLVFGYQDPENYCYIRVDTDSQRMNAGTVVAGVTDDNALINHPQLKVTANSKVEVYMLGDYVRFRIDNIWVAWAHYIPYPFATIPSSGVAHPQGKVGVYANNINAGLVTDFFVTELHQDWTEFQGFYSRDTPTAGGTQRTITVTAKDDLTPAKGIYRILDARTMEEAASWAYFEDNVVDGSDVTGKIWIPQCLNDGPAWVVEYGFIDSDGDAHAMPSMSTRCGILGICYGQSNAGSRGSASDGMDPLAPTPEQTGDDTVYPDNCAGYEIGQAYVQATLGDPGFNGGHPDPWWLGTIDRRTVTGPGWNTTTYAARTLSEMLDGAPIGIMSWGPAARGLDSFIPGHGDSWGFFTVVADLLGANPEFFMWDQGEGDWTNTDSATYGARLRDDFIPAVRDYFDNPDLPFLFELKGQYPTKYALGNVGSDASTIVSFNAHIQEWKNSVMAIVSDDDKIWPMDVQLGIQYPDAGTNPHDPDTEAADYAFWNENFRDYLDVDAHPAELGLIDEWRRTVISVAKYVFGVRDYDGCGLRIASGSRSGAVITLSPDMSEDGVTGLTKLNFPLKKGDGGPVTTTANLDGYQVFLASDTTFASPLTISSATVTGSSIVITLASNPGAACVVRSFYGYNQPDRILACGTYADDDPIPVFPILNPINVG